MNPAIIIPCYNRPFSLERLLHSLSTAVYPSSPVTLIISIDGPVDKDVKTIADSFLWKNGPKEVITQIKNIGLKKHILCCTDLVEQYENVIILEDDLLVSPYFYEYTIQAIDFYKEEKKLAGISLYNYQVSEFSSHSFEPVNDGSDVYFLQLPSSWGQVMNKKSWKEFKKWYQENENTPWPHNIPANVKDWGEHSWKKHFIHYLVSNDLYFVFPRVSLTTNFEELGTNSDLSGKYQVTIQNKPMEYSWSTFTDSQSVYDAFYEMTPESLNKWKPELSQYNYEVDLNGTKENTTAELVLTKAYSTSPVLSFSSQLTPLLQNVIYQQEGNELVLAKPETVNKKYRDDSLIRFFILIPIETYNEENIKITINSLLSNSYYNKKIILLTSPVFLIHLKELIKNHYYQNRFQMDVIISDADSQAGHLKNGFELVRSGVVTWLEPGNDQLSAEHLFNLNKAFKLEQVNSILMTNPNTNIENYRFTNRSIVHFLSKGHYLSPQNLFFRAGCWSKLNSYFLGSTYTHSMFFPMLLLGLVMEMNLSPMVMEDVAEKKIKHTASSSDFTK